MKKQGYNHKKPCKDHLGKRYSSLSEMCKAYDIKVDTFQRRINVYEWTIEDALTTPVKANGGQYCYDHQGRRFKSEALMCRHWGTNRKTYRYRIQQGLTVEEALTREAHPGKLLEEQSVEDWICV